MAISTVVGGCAWHSRLRRNRWAVIAELAADTCCAPIGQAFGRERAGFREFARTWLGDVAKAASGWRPRGPSVPLPSEYGGFAFANGQLTELELLAMRVPDQRVAISPAISTPSRTRLPAGKLEFILFRRDLANAAPDRVMVRVIAQVRRALTFGPSGKPSAANLPDTWVVRGNGYQMRVAPVPENPEMIAIRPDPPDFVFPAGRYALVLKGAAYDFTVEGATTDAAHCLERTDTVPAPIYNECRLP